MTMREVSKGRLRDSKWHMNQCIVGPGEVGVLEEERKRIGNIVWRVLA